MLLLVISLGKVGKGKEEFLSSMPAGIIKVLMDVVTDRAHEHIAKNHGVLLF